MEPAPSFTCPNCGRTSVHPRDVQESYCVACHRFADDLTFGRSVIRFPLPTEELDQLFERGPEDTQRP